MDKASIIEELENQLGNINQAIAALRGSDGQVRRGTSKVSTKGASTQWPETAFLSSSS
jgi:hypothetical protein